MEKVDLSEHHVSVFGMMVEGKFYVEVTCPFRNQGEEDFHEGLTVIRSVEDMAFLRSALMDKFGGCLLPPLPLTNERLYNFYSAEQVSTETL